MTRHKCCCPECQWKADDFNRPNSDIIANDWREELGNWRILSNQLKADAGNDALIVQTLANPAADESMCADAYIKASGKQRLIINYLNAANYLYGRYDFDNDRIEIWEKRGGVESMIRRLNAPSLGVEDLVLCTVQFSRAQLVASAATVNDQCVDCCDYIRCGYQGALFSENGGGIFDNFSIRQHDRTWKRRERINPCLSPSNCCYTCCHCISGIDSKGFDTWVCIPRVLRITCTVTGDFVGTDADGWTTLLTNAQDVQCDGVYWESPDNETFCDAGIKFHLECKGDYPRNDLTEWLLSEISESNNHCISGGSAAGNTTPDQTRCDPLQMVWGPYSVANADPPLPGEYCPCLPTPGSGTVTWTVTLP